MYLNLCMLRPENASNKRAAAFFCLKFAIPPPVQYFLFCAAIYQKEMNSLTPFYH